MSRRFEILKLALAVPLSILVFFLSGCRQTRNPRVTEGISNQDAMKVALQRELLGKSIVEARKLMEGEGFKLQMQENDTFVEAGREYRGLNYLYCTRSDTQGLSLVSQRWRIALVIKDEQISDVLISTSLDGP